MVDNTLLIGGGVVAAGLVWFMSQKSAPSTLEDTQATSFVGIGGDGDGPDNKEVAIEPVTEFLEDCAGATNTNDDDSTATNDDGSTATVCATPLWMANETVTLTHPLAATNSDFATYTFTVTIGSDIVASSTESAFAAMPEGQVIGDYSITATRSGASYESGRWTTDQNATFANGSITKSNALTPASSIIPSWDEVLTAFGGYMPGKIGGVGEEILMRSGIFSDVGEFMYEKQGADGNAYPVTVDKFGLTMSGTVIPMYAQMKVKCSSGSWVLNGNPVQVTPANTLGRTGDNADGSTCYAPCFPAAIPTSGVALGCELPTVSITYPSKIYVVCNPEAEDCSDRSMTSLGKMSEDEIWNLNPAITIPSTMKKGGWDTPSGAVHQRLTQSIGTPMVNQDGGGWYVKYSNGSKHYINSVLPGFKAAYTRQSIECDCPSDTMLEDTKFTLLDKYSCPGGFNILGGSNEWKTTYCGGLKPDYGCTDETANNYNENKVKDPTDTDICNPKYCTYPLTRIFPECETGGGGGGIGDFINPVTPISGGGDDVDVVTPLIPTNPCAGKTGMALYLCQGQNASIGGGNSSISMAENTLNARNFINTGHSFLNW